MSCQFMQQKKDPYSGGDWQVNDISILHYEETKVLTVNGYVSVYYWLPV